MEKDLLDSLNWNEISDSDEVNLKFKWNIKTIELFKDKINWTIFSSTKYITEEIIKEYPEYINWDKLSSNRSFKWPIYLIRNFKDKISWKLFSNNFQIKDSSQIGYILKEFIDYFDWDLLCKNNNLRFYYIFHYYNSDKLKLYNDKFNWKLLSENIMFEWNINLIEENKNKINWSSIILNPSVYKNNEILMKFHDLFEWSGHYKLFQHTHTYYPANISKIPDFFMPIEILKLHHKEWKESLNFYEWAEKEYGESEWSTYSANNCLISIDIMKEFDDYLDYGSIFRNQNFHWTAEKLDFCKNKRGFTDIFSFNQKGREEILKLFSKAIFQR